MPRFAAFYTETAAVDVMGNCSRRRYARDRPASSPDVLHLRKMWRLALVIGKQCSLLFTVVPTAHAPLLSLQKDS
jgi:hypothetical protein